MNVAIIPARGGSTRILRKNIKTFCGKPIIAWSIEKAIRSGCFDRILVSTDDDEIAAIAKNYGAEAPFKRPLELSDSNTGTAPVVRHAIEWLIASGAAPNLVCCMHATAPLMRVNDVIASLERLQKNDCEYVFPVTTFSAPIQRALRIDKCGRAGMFKPEEINTRSQDLELAFHDAAHFWWGRSSAWLQDVPVYSSASVPIKIPRQYVQDIDSPEDWAYAEMLFKLKDTTLMD